MLPVIASRSQRSHASRVAASRTSARAGTRAPAAALPKALTCALMALSVIASSLLAVALTVVVPEPTPAAAQLTGIAATTTTEINIDLKGDDKLTTHSDFGITHTVTASNCDAASGGQRDIVDTGQSNTTANSSLAEENNTSNQIYRHHIDYRCDWTITFTSADKCGVMVLPRGLSGAPIANGTARTGYAAVNTITLHKNPDYPTAIATGGGNNAVRENRRLVADTDDKDNTTVHTLEVSKCFTVVDVEQLTSLTRVDGESLENSLTTQTPAELGIASYTFKPTDCLAGIAPSSQTMASRVPHPTNDKVFRHILDVRCDWDVKFTGPADHCVMAEPTRRYIRHNQWYPEWDQHGNGVTVPFRLESDPVGPSGGGIGSSDPRRDLPRLTFQGQNAQVINLEVLPEANRQCVSSLQVFGVNGEASGTVRLVMESVQDASAKQLEPCESNAVSQRFANFVGSRVDAHYAQTFSSRWRHAPLVGRNCDWVVSLTPRFDAGRHNYCHFRVRLLDENGNLVRTRVRADHDYDSVYELYAAPNETVTIPFFGEDSRMRFTTWQQTSGSDTLEPVHHSISQVELTGCVVPPGSARLPIFDKAGDGFDLFYEIEPVECAGIDLPPSQNLDHWINSSFYERKTAPTDGTNPVDISYPAGFSGNDFVQDQTYLLSYYCDWEVSFKAAPIGMTPATKTNCEVKVWVWRSGAGTTAADAVYDTDGVVLLEGVPPAGQNPDGTFKYDSATSTNRVLGLYVTVDDSDGKCASDIAVSNTVSNTAAAGASATVEVSAIPDPMACTPHSRGPKPAGNLFLQGGESSTLTLAHDCAWKLAFSASNKNCVASAQLKDAAGDNIDTAMTTSFTTPEKTITLAKTDAGLTHTYTPTGGTSTTTVVAAIEFDGCVADSTPADTAKITVIDTTPSYGSSYQFTSSSCTGGASPASPVTNADAITSVDAETGNLVYVQYLNYNCNWEVSVISSDVCPVPFTIENAADPPAVVATGADMLTKDSDNSRFLIGTDTSKVVATIELGVDPTDSTCHLKLDFVNRSVPLAVAEGHAFRNEADQLIAPASGRPQNPRGQYTALDDQVPAADYQFPQVLLNFTPLDDTGAACTASNGTKPTEPVSIDAMSIKTTSEGNKLNKPVLDADGNYILTPNSETYQLDKTCNWLVEFVSVVSPPSELECFSAARVLGRDGKPLGTAALGSPYDGDLLQDVNNTPMTAQMMRRLMGRSTVGRLRCSQMPMA